MGQTLEQIEKERVNEPLALIENARELCRKKEFQKAVEALKT
jgi:DNA-binding XRE family transcriptional regulator